MKTGCVLLINLGNKSSCGIGVQRAKGRQNNGIGACCSLLTWLIVFLFQLCSTDRWVMSCACWEGQEGISWQRDSQDIDFRKNCWIDLMKRNREQWEVREVMFEHGTRLLWEAICTELSHVLSHLTQPTEVLKCALKGKAQGNLVGEMAPCHLSQKCRPGWQSHLSPRRQQTVT